jgi:DNA-binding IclR family transcriptional regulator
VKEAANKAKTARRVVEVFEYFDSQKRHATVMDIVRRYKRPQSSTSELMASLVDMGLLYKDPITRSYSPTPRAAILGALGQPTLVRDGKLWSTITDLAAQARVSVALIGMVGVNAQVFHTMPGAKALKQPMNGGQLERLVNGVAGMLLISTLSSDRRDGLLRRLNAEAPAEQKFNLPAVRERIEVAAKQGYAIGASGFGNSQMCAVLVPVEPGDRPLALGFVYDPSENVDLTNLLALLRKAVDGCTSLGSSTFAVEAASGAER